MYTPLARHKLTGRMTEDISMTDVDPPTELSVPMEVSHSSSGTASHSNVSLPSGGAMSFPENSELTVDSEGYFQWRLNKVSEIKTKEYSSVFRVGKHCWKLLVYPTGNDQHEGNSLSLYVAYVPEDEAKGEAAVSPSLSQSSDWAVCAQIILSVENIERPEICFSKYTQHRFDATEADWGFGAFCPLKTLHEGDANSQGTPLILNDSMFITARIRIIKDETGVLWHNFINYNSKQVTGFVGLANQGATCYMNSLLQSLYFTNAFRQALYLIPTESDVPSESSALALQRIFWRLQFSDVPVSTQELTRAFGWDTIESFIQSDVQEFSRVLMDELERRMKATKAEGTIEKLFTGRVRNVISCLNVPFQSTRTESFYDLQLTIKGMRTLEESFDNYVREEMLQGDNKYHAEGHGLQDARRFVEFEAFPPVLHVHLERYAFDPKVMATVKINDRLEFPLSISLDKYLAPDSPQKGQSQKYVLQGVFVHSGDSHGGHYYVYIHDPRDGEKSKWFRFDDTKVIPASRKEAVEDTFGGVADEDLAPRMGLRSRDKFRRFTNAYMLVYIRESDLENILCPINEEDIPAYIGTSVRAEDEAEKARRLEKQQQLMTIKAHILTDKHLGEHGGYDLFNFNNHNFPMTSSTVSRVRRDDTVLSLKESVAKDMGIEPSRLRFWTFALRRNKTVRLDEPIGAEDENKTLAHYYSRTSSQLPQFCLYAEVDGFEQYTKELFCVLFKFYDPEHGIIKIVGKLYVKPTATLEDVYPQLREMVGLPKNVKLEFFEEVKAMRIDVLSPTKSFAENQLQTGDIVCFQLAHPVLPHEVKLPKVGDYFRDLHTMLFIRLKHLVAVESGTQPDPSDLAEIISARISLNTPFLELTEAVAGKIKAVATHVRLYLIDEIGDLTVLKPPSEKATLEETLSHVSLPSNIATEGLTIACEATMMPVAELDSMKRIRLTLVDEPENIDQAGEECIVYIGVKDTPNSLVSRLPTTFQNALERPIRIIESHNNRVIRDYIEDDSLASIGETSTVYIEGGVDPTELDPPRNHLVISVFSYAAKEPSRAHSRPFRFLLRPSEPWRLTKKRLFTRLGNPPEADKWTFSIVSYGRARVIGDDDILASTTLGPHDQIGIGRPDPSASSTGLKSAPISSGIERSIKIRSSAKN
ncbi:hypothetical protein PSACC_03542 [Paramicrosporidium saccamoebae]|uniref:ubiquitinyl hydrolase 1 n=1 Tax=Paramicrosporidium saccamoebae TaxID=1246581 RepID=A0A2H9TFR2_9FUNG|nr:hypothetical protein PSACC_03542 [Paramicrosporidium saccamoebae]